MNARPMVIAAVLGALTMPAAATAKPIPNGEHGAAPDSTWAQPSSKKPAGKKTVSAHVHRRVLCICIVRTTSSPGVPFNQEEFERQYDADMVAHSLEPVFGSSPSRST